ncbi:hypothetical protein EVAR_64312_1 [Eumeta japonica]|uniref:Uncharacterized protein n=1 Tax=Eumeta variegata TaxID=151549 RepID=A0A4C2ACP1_EUMVA|nr:hypothetical protein EVAR_64312_1 [Eumeta japonica]
MGLLYYNVRIVLLALLILHPTAAIDSGTIDEGRNGELSRAAGDSGGGGVGGGALAPWRPVARRRHRPSRTCAVLSDRGSIPRNSTAVGTNETVTERIRNADRYIPLPATHSYALEKLYFFGIIKNEPKLDGVASFNYGVPIATFQLHHQTLITIEYQSTRQDESNEPKLDGVASFNYGVPMATF